MGGILGLIPVDITGSKITSRKFKCGPFSPAGSGDGITLVAVVTLIFVIHSATWHFKMQFIICAIVVYWDVSVSASDLRLLKHYFKAEIVKKNYIVNSRFFHADD
jgi:hypothetical protein